MLSLSLLDRQAVPILSAARIKEYAREHIPYRVHFVEMGIFAGVLIGRGAAQTPGPVEVAGYRFEVNGKKIFLNMAVESALIYCRVLLNFLGIYKLQRSRRLESRRPTSRHWESEVWIERFPGGRLLTTTELCRFSSTTVPPRTLRAYIVETLDSANRGVAHLTVPKGKSIAASKLKVRPFMMTCMAIRHYILEHFYKTTLRMEPPEGMTRFDAFLENHLIPVERQRIADPSRESDSR